MTLTVRYVAPKHMTFQQLSSGDLFTFAEGVDADTAYMKVRVDKADCQAVRLESGRLVWVGCDVPVVRLKGTLTLEE